MLQKTLREKRIAPRVSCRLLAAAQIRNKPAELIITDISETGAKVESNVKLGRNMTFPLSVRTTKAIFAEAEFKRNTVIVKVAWCRSRYGKRFTAGLLFADSKENLRRSWVYYILDRFGVSPENIFKQRDSLRIFTEIPVSCEVKDGDAITGVIENISLGGVLILTRREIPKDTLLTLSIGPYNAMRQLRVMGKVIRVTPAEKPSHWLTGVSFYEPGKGEIGSLRKLILNIMNEEVF